MDENNAKGGRGFEALAVVLLSLATVGMAWCSYQASGWSTRSGDLSLQSASLGRDVATFRIKAEQGITRDTFVFGEYLKAVETTNETLAKFYRGRFSPELKQAHEAWKARGSNGDDPFATNFYRAAWLAQAEAAEPESERLWYEAGEAGETSHQYTLISVLLATALFFGGTAPRFERPRKRCIVLALGLATLLTSLIMFVTLPRSKDGWFVHPKAPPEFIGP
jgi:hypothetical protein